MNPETFPKDENVRIVAGWFFPRGTERRMLIKQEQIPQIMHFIEHAYSATSALIKKRHDAAVKAWGTIRRQG